MSKKYPAPKSLKKMRLQTYAKIVTGVPRPANEFTGIQKIPPPRNLKKWSLQTYGKCDGGLKMYWGPLRKSDKIGQIQKNSDANLDIII